MKHKGVKAPDVFEPCQDSRVSQVFNLITANGGKILSNIMLVENRKVEMENSSLPVAVRDLLNVPCLNSLL